MSDTNGDFHGVPGNSGGDETCAPDVAPEASALLSTLTQAVTRRYGFRIGPYGFLVAAQAHSEVVLSPTICPLPQSPRWLLGLINLRSNLVPVFDLHALCGLTSLGSHAHTTVLVIDSGESAVGMPVEGLPVALANLRETAELPTLPAALSKNVRGYASDGGDVWVDFNHGPFFSTVIQSNELTTGRAPGSPDTTAL